MPGIDVPRDCSICGKPIDDDQDFAAEHHCWWTLDLNEAIRSRTYSGRVMHDACIPEIDV